MPDLAGSGAVVLGGGQGIGEATARALSENGATVACIDLVAERAEAVAAGIRGIAIEADVSERGQVASAFERARAELPPLRAVVDVVGIASWGRLEELGEAEWERDLALNLKHAWHCVAVAGPILRANGGGSIVLVASVSGITGAPQHGLYGAAKAGVMSLARSAAVELAPGRVRVNAISPGAVLTPRIRDTQRPETLAAQAERIPLGRLAEPGEIGDLAVFLAGPRSAYITGTTVVIDGGTAARYAYLTPGAPGTGGAAS